MVAFRLSNLVFLIIVVIWIYLGTLPWREQNMIDQIETSENPDLIYSRLPFGINSSRAYIRKNLVRNSADIEALELEARKNIQDRPLLADSWLDLAEIKYRQSDFQAAINYAAKAQNLWPTASYSLYRVGSFWLKMGQIERAIKTFGQYLGTSPTQIPTVLSITTLLESDTDRLVELLFAPDSTTTANHVFLSEHMLYYAIKHRFSQLAASIWDKFNVILLDNDQLVIRYINYLIRHNLIDQALSVWEDYSGGVQIKEVFLNAGFESEILHSGFGWNIPDSTQFEWNIDKDIAYQGNNSLRIEFSGENNINYYQLQQIIPVQPGAEYKVTAHWRGQGITTGSTPYIELSALYTSQGTTSHSENKRGNWSWQKVETSIEVPKDSALLRVRVRRDRTRALDKKIAGTMWLDNFTIEKITY